MYKVLQTEAAGEQRRKPDSESPIHVMTTADRWAPWNKQVPHQGSRRGERITQLYAAGESWQMLSINPLFPRA